MKSWWKTFFGVASDDFAGTESWSLRFTGIPENTWWLFGLIALFAILCVLTVRSYRGEGKWPARVKMAVAGLRLTVLLLLLATVLQPALVLRFVREQNSAVVVLVDDTASMQWRDRYGDPAERAAMAALLSVEESRLDGDDRLSRTEAVRRALAREKGLLARLLRDHPLEICRFGVSGKDSSDYTESVTSLQMPARSVAADAAGGPVVPADLDRKLEALGGQGQFTDLSRALREVLNRREGSRVAAIVIVSDGQCTDAARGADRLAGACDAASQRGIPVFTVGVGDPRPPRNVAVTQLRGPREARVGTTISFTAFVTQRSLPETALQVRLFRGASADGPWEDTGVAESLTIGGSATAPDGGRGGAAPGAESLYEARLTVDAPDAGVHVYKAAIEPLPDEMIRRDNEAAATVRVTDRKMKALLISADASWEFQYLRNFLLREQDSYGVSSWQQNADARFNQDASLGMKRVSLPKTRDELMEFDVVILCDPRFVPDSFDEGFVRLLDEFVSKHYGGLCYIAGRKHTEKNLLAGGPFASLGELLPVVPAPLLGRREECVQAFPIELTAEGTEMPLLRLADDPDENAEVWRRLPGQFWCQKVARPKSLARVLAVKSEGAGLAAREEGDPAIAVQYYGKGRVLYLGFNGLWRWRGLKEADRYKRFWTNVLNFLGAGRLEKKRILVTTGEEVFDAGTDIGVRVEAYNIDYDPLAVDALVLEMRPVGGGDATMHTLRREKPGVFSGIVSADRVGAFELDVKSDAAGKTDWTPEDVAVRRISVRTPQAETKRPEADYDALRVLAGDPGRFVTLSVMDSLGDRIPPARTTAVTEMPHTLWDTLFMLVLIGALLLAEWTLRKVFHMM